jgi:hypothetical protein
MGFLSLGSSLAEDIAVLLEPALELDHVEPYASLLDSSNELLVMADGLQRFFKGRSAGCDNQPNEAIKIILAACIWRDSLDVCPPDDVLNS